MDETDKLLKDIEEKESPRINIELNEQQIRSVKNLLIKGFKMATAENKEELITSTVDLIKIDFIPRRLKKKVILIQLKSMKYISNINECYVTRKNAHVPPI